MHQDIAVKTQNISKMYRLYASQGDRLRAALNPFRRVYHREFWALRDINLEIPKGQTIGILGLNGSGKSTLLQIIASILQPTSGTLHVNGKVAALLEVGAGLNSELTGRENAILNGTVLGLSRAESLERVKDIEAYADIGEFFDQPMKTYSSGMFMRVAFSTALYVDPDILIIDEMLAVGDAKFQEKCFRRFRAFQEAGKTILFVTHDRSALPRHCGTGILLHGGEVIEVGEPKRIADLYGELLAFGRLRRTQPTLSPSAEAGGQAQPTRMAQAPSATADKTPVDTVLAFMNAPSTEDHCPQNPTYNKYEHRSGNGHAEIIDYMLADGDVVNPATCYSGTTLRVYVKVIFKRSLTAPILGIILKNKEGVIAYGGNTEWMRIKTRPATVGAVQCYCFAIPLQLCAGDWFIDLAVAETTPDLCDNRSSLAHLFLIEERSYTGLVRLDAQFSEL